MMRAFSLARWLLAPAAAFLVATAGSPCAEEAGAEGPGRASELLLRSQSRHIHSDERLSLALGAARVAFSGMIAGHKGDTEIYNAAITQIVAAVNDPDKLAARNNRRLAKC